MGGQAAAKFCSVARSLEARFTSTECDTLHSPKRTYAL